MQLLWEVAAEVSQCNDPYLWAWHGFKKCKYKRNQGCGKSVEGHRFVGWSSFTKSCFHSLWCFSQYTDGSAWYQRLYHFCFRASILHWSWPSSVEKTELLPSKIDSNVHLSVDVKDQILMTFMGLRLGLMITDLFSVQNGCIQSKSSIQWSCYTWNEEKWGLALSCNYQSYHAIRLQANVPLNYCDYWLCWDFHSETKSWWHARRYFN